MLTGLAAGLLSMAGWIAPSTRGLDPATAEPNGQTILQQSIEAALASGGTGAPHVIHPGRQRAVALAAERSIQAPVTTPQVPQPTRKAHAKSSQVFSGTYQSKLRVEVTSYWANPAWSNGYTYTGIKAHRGVIAVDPRVIPLGTELYVPGYGYGKAEDTGGAIKGDHIDVFFPTASQVDHWGLKHETIYIIKK